MLHKEETHQWWSQQPSSCYRKVHSRRISWIEQFSFNYWNACLPLLWFHVSKKKKINATPMCLRKIPTWTPVSNAPATFLNNTNITGKFTQYTLTEVAITQHTRILPAISFLTECTLWNHGKGRGIDRSNERLHVGVHHCCIAHTDACTKH